MYNLTDNQVDFILDDIKKRGIKIESLQQNLLDHICCIIEEKMNDDDDFEQFYSIIIQQFYKNELLEIETETNYLLTFKNFYFMKKVLILSGIATASSFVLGSIFKIMWWPGASFFFVIAIALTSLLFLPLLFILKNKELKNVQEKLVLASAIVVGILYSIAILGSVMHWQMAKPGTFWLITIGFSFFVFIPLYFFNGIKKADAKLNTIITTCLFVIFISLQFLMVRIHPATNQLNENKMVNVVK
jgi:asparagine N-glycosylation enzyme membrane subunit Stt3